MVRHLICVYLKQIRYNIRIKFEYAMQTESGLSAVKRGLFIVFEGLDRSGKSTQSKMLAKYLSEEMQIPVKSLAFPSK